MKIHLWCPELFIEKGGIQRYSQFLLDSLQLAFPDSQLEVFLKHDLVASSSESVFQTLKNTKYQVRFHSAGHCPIKLRTVYFAGQIMSAGFTHRPDLIITSHLNFTPVAQQLKRWFNIPYWTSAHGIESWNITKPQLKSALQDADKILSVSTYTRDRLITEQALSPDAISLLPNTFDASCFKIGHKPDYLLERYSLQPDQPVIFSLGRLAPEEAYKGYDNILQALPAIRQSIPNVHYILAGKGEDRPRLEALIQKLQLQNDVTLAGFIPESELVDHYNLCNVFAMPSKGEGFGIVYLEALACGKPVLGGNQDGATDALCHGELGALVNPDSTLEIASTLIEILDGTYPNPLIYQPKKLRQAVIKTFGLEKFQQTLCNHLQESFAVL
jgi:glycosyltransferase involved in cell wall biosynthesis